MFINSIIFFTLIGIFIPLVCGAYKYVKGELRTGTYGDDELLYTVFPIIGGILGAMYFLTVPVFTIYFIVSFLLNTMKDKIGNSSLDDELRRMVHNTIYASDVFNKINRLKKSKFSSGMMLDEYRKELEQVVLTVGTKPNYNGDGFSIPYELRQKFRDIVQEFSDLVDIAGEQINQYEEDERKKIAEFNLKAMDDVHKLLQSIKKDKIEGRV